ncbi:MAG: hypothetical protein R3E79_51815 [Caldilineaceae bacterium]
MSNSLHAISECYRSPSGELYLSSDTALHTISKDGNTIGELPNENNREQSIIIAPTSDGKQVAYVTATQGDTQGDITLSVFVADIRFSNSSKILSRDVHIDETRPPSIYVPGVSLGSWSSSGSMLAFSLIDDSLASDIYIYDGQSTQLLIDNSDSVWSYPVEWVDEETVLIYHIGSLSLAQDELEFLKKLSFSMFNVEAKESTQVAPQIAPSGIGPTLFWDTY